MFSSSAKVKEYSVIAESPAVQDVFAIFAEYEESVFVGVVIEMDEDS